MRSFVVFVLYLLGALVLSALLLPYLYPSLDAWLGADATPDRVLYRSAMLLMVLGLPWLLQAQGLADRRLAGFTLPARRAWWAIFSGLGIGLVMLAVPALGLVGVGARVVTPLQELALGGLLETLFAAMIGGLLIALIEEMFFRGLMHTAMRRSLSAGATVWLSAMFYAAVHFIAPAEAPVGQPLDTGTALKMVWVGVSHLADLASIYDSFLALLVGGLLLAAVRERSGGILWCIGIHAGWVMVVKTTKYFTDVAPGTSLWLGEYDRFTGLLVAIWLTLLTVAYWLATRRTKQHLVVPGSTPAAD